MKIAILGAGNMGSWFANRLKKEHKIWIYDQKKGLANKVSGINVLSEIS